MSVAFFERNGRTAADYVNRYEHGTRARYHLGKCRCLPCTDANREYERERRLAIDEATPWKVDERGAVAADGFKTLRVRNRVTGAVDSSYTVDIQDADSCRYIPAMAKRRARFLNRRDGVPRDNELIDVCQVRAHVEKLRASGVGLKTIALRAGIAYGTLRRIMGFANGHPGGAIRRTRRDVFDAIVAVVPEPRGTVKVDPAETWRLIEDLLARGWTRAWIARKIGNSGPGLQIKRHSVTAATARKIRELHARLEGLYPAPRAIGTKWAYTPPPGAMTAEP